MATLASDAFGRSVSGGWGNADSGGAWTPSNSTYFSVNGSGGIAQGVSGTTTFQRLTSVSSSATEILVTFSAAGIPNAGAAHFYIVPRSVTDTPSTYLDYSVDVNILNSGIVQMQPRLAGVFGDQTQIFSTYSSNQNLTARVQALGTNPTTLRARVWLTGQTEPSTWQVNVIDSTTSTQVAAPIALGNYLSSSATNGPINYTWDNLVVSSVVAATTNPITVSATTQERYLIDAASTPQNGGTISYSISPSSGTSVIDSVNGIFSVPVPSANTQVTYTVTAIEAYSGGSQSSNTTVTLDGGSGTSSQATFQTLVRVNGSWQ